MGAGDTLPNAVIGAVVTLVFSFVGVSPLVGGGVAGYLQRRRRREGARVGALSGALATVPTGLVLLVGLGVLGFDLTGEVGPSAVLLVVLLLLGAWNVGLGAVGGYLGVVVREEL
ncbi:MAG: DUF5518 domain-containing protein [Halolamina sp.]